MPIQMDLFGKDRLLQNAQCIIKDFIEYLERWIKAKKSYENSFILRIAEVVMLDIYVLLKLFYRLEFIPVQKQVAKIQPQWRI